MIFLLSSRPLLIIANLGDFRTLRILFHSSKNKDLVVRLVKEALHWQVK